MARPSKNNADYFPHDGDMRNHRKIKALRVKFGITGYAVWSMFLEHLTHCEFNRFVLSDMEIELLAGDFGVPAAKIHEILHYCISLELLLNEEGIIHSKSLDENLKPVFEKRGKGKLLRQKPLKTGITVAETPKDNGVTVTEMPQSKEEERKVNKKKEDNSHEGENVFSFEDFWNMYDKKVYEAPCRVEWQTITAAEKELIRRRLPDYVTATPDKKFRKDPLHYLANKGWLNEMVKPPKSAIDRMIDGELISGADT